MEKHKTVVAQLKAILDGNSKMAKNLEASLQKAADLAVNGDSTKKSPIPPLNKDLYKAIDNEFKKKGWPTSLNDYYDYLDVYVRLVPNEEPGTHYAWTSDGTKNGYNQKV